MFPSPASRRSKIVPGVAAGARQPLALVFGVAGALAVDHHYGHGLLFVTPPVERISDDRNWGRFARHRRWPRRDVVQASRAFGWFGGTG